MSDMADPSRIRRFSDFPSSYVAYVHTSDVGGHAQGGRRDLSSESYVKLARIRPRTEILFAGKLLIVVTLGVILDANS